MTVRSAAHAKWQKYYDNLKITFWDRVDQTAGHEGCWPYQGSRRANGYGRLRIRGKHELAHRMAYRFKFGVDPTSFVVMHTCDNPPCCNPHHLVLGNHSDNMADRSRKGRAPMHKAILNAADVKRIIERLNLGATGSSLAREFGVGETAISRIKNGRTWTALRARGVG